MPPSSRGGILSLVFGKEFPVFPSHLKRRRSPQERRDELQGRATIPRVPQMSQSIPGKTVSLNSLDFQAKDRLTPRWRVGQPFGKASWECIVGKPRGKATNPLIHAKGSVILLLQLGRKAHVHAPTQEEDSLSWEDSRNTPRSMSALERNPQVPARLHSRSYAGVQPRWIQGIRRVDGVGVERLVYLLM